MKVLRIHSESNAKIVKAVFGPLFRLKEHMERNKIDSLVDKGDQEAIGTLIIEYWPTILAAGEGEAVEVRNLFSSWKKGDKKAGEKLKTKLTEIIENFLNRYQR